MFNWKGGGKNGARSGGAIATSLDGPVLLHQRAETCPGNGQRVVDNINTFVGSFLLYVQADKSPCIPPSIKLFH